KLDPNSVVALFQTEKNARVIVMVGSEALKKGLRADEIVKEAAIELGGGGSGKPHFAQGGGTLTVNVPRAIMKVKVSIKNKIKRKF
ncbi:TPA: hypothetical protein EYP70_05785, partial [Candidatus Bathyarchaeota archaeon]|nr:hypothetical protein [Candidatus Bathyarchaeota archaeon]